MKAPVVLTPRCVWPAKRLLGEGPWWSSDQQSLYWVDIKDPAILRYRPSDGARDVWPCPEPIGAFVPRASGGFIGAFRSGIYNFTLAESGTLVLLERVAVPSGHAATDRFNDGKCHPDGSFWAGTMDDAEREARGWFYRFDPSGILDRKHGPFMVCNGPAFSRDGKIAYFTDSARRKIYRQDLSGPPDTLKAFVDFPEHFGYPDGMTVDTENRLWVAFWDGAKVCCFIPSGEIIAKVNLPVLRPTSCTFGGPGMNRLYVTSASIGLSEKGLEDGGLFEIGLVGAEGNPFPAFGSANAPT